MAMMRVSGRAWLSVFMVSALVLSSGATGCYTHREVDTEVVPVGTRIVAQLTERGTLEMVDTLGGSAVSVSGRVQSATVDRMIVALNRVNLRQGTAVTWAGEPVGIPKRYVNRVRERKLSVWRSVLTGAAVATGFLLLIDSLGMDVGFPGGGGGDGNGLPGGSS